MRSYVPNTVEERREMLKTLGLSEMDELFADIPADLKLNRELDLPAPMSEMELRQLITGYVLQNDEACLLFRGAGAYNHYIPALHSSAHLPQRILHRIHPLSGGNEPGYASGYFRMANSHLQSYRAWMPPTLPFTTVRPLRLNPC